LPSANTPNPKFVKTVGRRGVLICAGCRGDIYISYSPTICTTNSLRRGRTSKST
jgi:hypothetical protein